MLPERNGDNGFEVGGRKAAGAWLLALEGGGRATGTVVGSCGGGSCCDCAGRLELRERGGGLGRGIIPVPDALSEDVFGNRVMAEVWRNSDGILGDSDGVRGDLDRW